MPKNNLSDEEIKSVEDAIHEAEHRTSGELRVFIDNHCKGDVLDRAAYVFHSIGMDKTKDRTGVLIYLAIKDHKFAIIGDEGINAKVERDFWNHTRDEMQKYFVAGDFVSGLKSGILHAGDKLSMFFPKKENDTNELSNEIHFGQ